MSYSKGYFYSLKLNASGHMLAQSFGLKVYSAKNCQQTQISKEK